MGETTRRQLTAYWSGEHISLVSHIYLILNSIKIRNVLNVLSGNKNTNS